VTTPGALLAFRSTTSERMVWSPLTVKTAPRTTMSAVPSGTGTPPPVGVTVVCPGLIVVGAVIRTVCAETRLTTRQTATIQQRRTRLKALSIARILS
jgi:hypothetical protein